MTEHEEQAAVIAWRDLRALTDWRVGLLYAIPNGGHRAPKTARTLKAEGVLAGMPDLCLPVSRDGDYTDPAYGALYIEMKAEHGRTSAVQNERIVQLVRAGNQVAVCHSAGAAIETICDYLGIEEGA